MSSQTILGVTIGDLDCCSSFIATTWMEARALISLLEQVGMMDPKLPWSFISVVGFVNWCTWLIQHVPPSLSSKAFSFFDDDIRRAYKQCLQLGINTFNIAWEQAQLTGGLGLWSLSHLSSAAFILHFFIWLWFSIIHHLS